ncbi:MAG: LysR family transcriptional regulator [Oscillospiraceae bacterium]|nr:LysR family transcriptional regulator [Oscillospiraceae bacterium]
MDFQKLEIFVRVCDCGSITRAAEKLYVSQPSLSRTISSLEQQHNCTFFDRSGNRITLNQNGKKFYRFAKKVLRDYGALCEEFAKEKKSTPLHICYNDDSFAEYILPELIRNPAWYVMVTNASEKEMILRLTDGTCDLGFSTQKLSGNGVRSRFFLSSETFISVPNNNPLSRKKSLSLSDLDGQSILYLDNKDEHLQQFIQLLRKKAPSHKIENAARCGAYELLKKDTDSLYFLNTYERLFFPDLSEGRKILRVDDAGTVRKCYVSYCESREEIALELLDWITKMTKRRWYQATHSRG